MQLHRNIGITGLLECVMVIDLVELLPVTFFRKNLHSVRSGNLEGTHTLLFKVIAVDLGQS